MRKFIAIICLAIFSFQVIPVRALGKLLASAQMTEEIPHDCNAKSSNDLNKKLFVPISFATAISFENATESFAGFITTEALFKCLHLDVLIQPPNC